MLRKLTMVNLMWCPVQTHTLFVLVMMKNYHLVNVGHSAEKHFLAVFKHSDISFNCLPERYKNHAAFIVDIACLGVDLSSLGCENRTGTTLVV